MFNTIIRTIILYGFVILGIRIMGKRQVGDLQPGELVVTILISEIAAIPIQDVNQPVVTGIVSIFSLVIIEVLVSFISMKFSPVRKLLNGSSAIIIKDGKIDQKLIKNLRITVPDILEVLRGEKIFDINQVDYAILETNGRISVLLKPPYQATELKDITDNFEKSVLPFLVISDGKIVKQSLKLSGFNQDFIKNILRKKGLKIKDVFIMNLDQKGKHNIIKKDV